MNVEFKNYTQNRLFNIKITENGSCLAKVTKNLKN